MFIKGPSRYRKGDHNAVSDDSGQKYKRSKMRMRWDGKLVGADEWEPEPSQLRIIPRYENPAVRDTRTQNADSPLAVPPFNPAGQV
jgi:hypothetical protein